jgi:hypothetical protein
MKTKFFVLIITLIALQARGQKICSFNCVNGGVDPQRIGVGLDISSLFKNHKGYRANLMYFGDELWAGIGFEKIVEYRGDVQGIAGLFQYHGANRAYSVQVLRPLAETYSKVVPYIGITYEHAHINYQYIGDPAQSLFQSYEDPVNPQTQDIGYFRLNRNKIMLATGMRLSAGPLFFDLAIFTGASFSNTGRIVPKFDATIENDLTNAKSTSDPMSNSSKWKNQAALAPLTKTVMAIGQLSLTAGVMF